jgi:hypothetical protein
MWPRGKTLDNAVVIGVEEGGLYKLKGHSDSAMIHDIVNPSELWHRRFAHLHYKALPVVSKMVTGLPKIQAEPDGVCKGCAQGKNVKHSFSHSDNRAKGVLDIMHSDVCGPMLATSLSGYVYYVSFIDDYSRKTWIYLLKEKNEVSGKLKEFKALVENLTERKIKTLRSNNGGEFTSEEFKEYYKEVVIKRELSTPYNPQQNGIVERKNQTIMEAVKVMSHDQDLPMHLWAEAAKTTVYMQNKSLHKVLENKTPEEMFSREKPEVSHFRIFGCPVFFHVPREKRTKLDPSGQKGIFVGYSDTSKAYMIYIPGHRKVEISGDVTFNENATFSKSKQIRAEEVHEEENEFPKVPEAVEPEDVIPEDHDIVEPHKPTKIPSRKRRPAWAQELIGDAERIGALEKSFRESKKSKSYSNYVACLCDIMDAEPFSYEEAAENQVWKDAMAKEYQPIMQNNVWDVVPRPKENLW